LLAVTVSMEAPPGAVAAGLAAIVTVGWLAAGVGVGVGEVAADEAAVPLPHDVLIARTVSATKMNEAEHNKV
jgi:hypothetical protein